jgi:tryptophanyl-tRNA synthetase
MKTKVKKDAQNSMDISKTKKIKADLKSENDIKYRQLKRELLKEMKEELSEFRKNLENDNFKDDLNVSDLFNYCRNNTKI